MVFLRCLKCTAFLTLSFLINSTLLASTFDIYRTDQITQEQVEKKFGKDLREILKMLDASSDGELDPGSAKKIKNLANKVTAGIHSMGDFAYVNIKPIIYPYPGEKTDITIDVVDKEDMSRIKGFYKKKYAKHSEKIELIKKWEEYQGKGFSIVLEKKDLKFNACPAHHCVYGFDEEALKPYFTLFNQQVPKNKQKLIQVLKNHSDEEQRVAAVFLLAHLKDSKELIEILEPCFDDPSILVRNAVMRVFGSLAHAKKVTDFPMEKIVALIDASTTLERNKALIMMGGLVEQPKYADYVKKHALPTLLALLKLEQKNQHEPAYSIFRKLSGQNWSRLDYPAWERWVNQTIEANKKKSCPCKKNARPLSMMQQS